MKRKMTQTVNLQSQNRYEIELLGQPDDDWKGWFEGAKITTSSLADGSHVTRLSEIVMDQAGLVGLIRRLHGLGFVLLSIRRV